ncbi:MAG TPA: FGGY family carbohydrate kinase [Actinomycetes bacterium]|nr:FGGY family carbohydrate kinase [Actinomycetes bacterium]
MSEELLVGIDVGTTSCKAAVVRAGDGVEAAHGAVPTPWTVVPSGAELAPARLLDAALAATAEALAAAPDGPVLGVGVTSMAETGVLLDRHGRPVAPAIAWHDARGEAEAARLAADLGAERFSARTGLPVRPLFSIAKYAWLRANHPEVAGAVRWLGVAEWVVHGLGGRQVAELSLASRTGLLDLERRAWWEEARAWAGAPPGLLAELVQAGSPAGQADGARLPRLAGATLTVAGHDHLSASVGAGATRPGDLFDSSGTAEALIRAVPPPVAPADVARLVAGNVTVGWHVLPGQHALLGASRAGLGLRRFLDLLGVDEQGRAELDRAAAAAPPGSGGLAVRDVFGETAALEGIGADPAPALVWRAALEAVTRRAAELRAHIESVAGPSRRLVLAGGWARSPAARSVKRALLGPFEWPRVTEAGARGAALLAGVAAGRYAGIGDLPETIDSARERSRR